ncbi:MAG: hypothetical protein HQK54_13135, partial [Oligoflexales bacterium]|nr:hypothetical protein [Oligoflexales bacterium]
VKNFMYGGKYPWSDFKSVSLAESLPRILARTNGYAHKYTLRGHFEVENLGRGELYVEADRPPFIILKSSTSFLILGDKDPGRTRELFEKIKEAWSLDR